MEKTITHARTINGPLIVR